MVGRMTPDRHVDRLMDKLLRAIELSLRATEASRDAVQEILRRGAETGIFFAGTKAPKARRGLRADRAGPRLSPLAVDPS